MNPKAVILALITIALIVGYAFYTRAISGEELRFSVNGHEALRIVESDEKAAMFIKENFFNESERLTDVRLSWEKNTNEYVWEIKITERECGCRGIEGLNVLEAKVDPRNGKILELRTRIGVNESLLARETCEKGCHVV